MEEEGVVNNNKKKEGRGAEGKRGAKWRLREV